MRKWCVTDAPYNCNKSGCTRNRSEDAWDSSGVAVTTVVQNFSPAGEKIKLEFVNASATKDELKLILSITGIDLFYNPDAFGNIVCKPNIVTEEGVGKTFVSYSNNHKDPNEVTYVYALSGNTYKTLHIVLDWTIGPCGPSGYDESNVTPFPVELMTNYTFTFNVPVE